MLEGSGVKPLFLCVKIFVTVTFLISIRQKPGYRESLESCYWGCYWSIFPSVKVCIQNGRSVWLLVNGQTFFFFKKFCWLPCLRELTVPRMLLSCDWGPTKWDTESRSVPVSTCMQAFTVHPTGSAQHGFGTPLSKAEEEVFSWKYCFAFIFVPLNVPSPAFLQVQWNLRGTKLFKWYIWETIGRSDGRLDFSNWPQWTV